MQNITPEDKIIFAKYANYIHVLRAAYPDMNLTAYFDIINDRPVMVVNQLRLGMNKIFIMSTNFKSDSDNMCLISEITARVQNANGRCFIESFATSPEFQNNGYGSYLLNIVKHACKENDTYEIYGQVCPFDAVEYIPQRYLEQADYDEFRAQKLMLEDYYTHQGFDVEHILTPHTDRRTGKVSYSEYTKLSAKPQTMETTKSYPNGFFDIENNKLQIINYDEVMFSKSHTPSHHTPTL